MRLLQIDQSLYTEMKQGIANMLEKEDISLLCSAFEQAHGNERGVRDIIQGEVTFQEVVFNRLLVCRNLLDKIHSEYVVNKRERESNQQTKKKSIDIVYTDHEGKRRFCFELKNIRTGDLAIGQGFAQNYDRLKEISDSIARMAPNEVLNLALKPKQDFEHWFHPLWAPTIGKFIDHVQKDVVDKYQVELQKDDQACGRALSWVIVRVGLGKVLCNRVF